MRGLLLLLPLPLLVGCSLFQSEPEGEGAAPATASSAAEEPDPPADTKAAAPAPAAAEQAGPPPPAASPGPAPAEPAAAPAPAAPPRAAPLASAPAVPPQAAPPPPPLAGEAVAEAESQARVTLVADDLDVRLALAMLAHLAGVRLELSPWVQGRVSLTVVDEPFRRAAEQVLVQVGEFELSGHGDLLQVAPRPLVFTGEVIEVAGDRLKLRRDEEERPPEVVTVEVVVPPPGAQDSASAVQLRTQLGELEQGQRVAVTWFPLGEQRVLTSLATRTDEALQDAAR